MRRSTTLGARRRMTGRVSIQDAVPVAACCPEAESTRAQSEVRSASRLRRQRGIRTAEKQLSMAASC